MPRGCDFETVLLLLPQLAAVEVRSVAVVDLDKAVHGIGWWKAYPDLDRQTRILLSDYLAACARTIPDKRNCAQPAASAAPTAALSSSTSCSDCGPLNPR
jgi:hypothetical protein